MLIPGIIVCNFILITTHNSLTVHFSGCHSPPVSDKELISIIKAFNAVKHKPAAKLIWQCGICIKFKNAVNQQNRQLIAVKKATPRQVPAPQKPIVIDIDDDDDDDEIITLHGPSELPKHNETTNPEVSHLSNAVVATQDTAAYNHPSPSGTKDKQIRIIDDPFLVPNLTSKPPQISSSTKPQVISEFFDLTVSSDEGGGSDDDALEYLTPAPTSKQAVDIVHLEGVTSNQVLPSPLPRDTHLTAQPSTMITTIQPPNDLITRWLNDRSTIAGVRPDIWARACLRRDQDAANKGNLESESTQHPSISPPSRRKYKAYSLNERSLTHLRAPLFLSAEGWLREKQTRSNMELY